MLEQLGAFQTEIRRSSVTREAMVDTIAATVLHTITGHD